LKKFTFLAFAAFFTACFSPAGAQQKQADPVAQRVRCGTMEALESYLQSNPEARAIAERNKTLLPDAPTSTSNNQRTNAIMTIPVVVHLVLPAADMAKVTDADVQWQIDQLNRDFSGLNPDSTNATGFYSVRGHSEIRFCLAKQDPNGNPTNGINRVVSSITDFSSATVNQLKYASSCGSESWDCTKYFNIWVGKSVSLLGIATFPGTGPCAEQGIALALDGFSNNPAYVIPAFNRGRTAVHEAGHFFGLYHIWGDESACSQSDFRQMPGTCLVSGADIVGTATDNAVGDTPNQTGATSGCPSGTQASGCADAPSPPGKQYQNFMDYTDDGCYSMFTIKQVKRMEQMLTSCRASLINSTGCTPVTQFANDAFLFAIFNPGPGACGVTGTSSFCAGGSITPSVEIRNLGTNNINSITIYTQVDNNTPTAFTPASFSLAPYGRIVLNLPSVAAPAATGAHTIKIYTSNPNGVTDPRTGNDTLTRSFTVGGGVSLPLVEGFEGTAFPPPNWTLLNPDNGITWARVTNARNSGTASARVNFFSYSNRGRRDNLITPNLAVGTADSLWLDFYVAYSPYNSDNDSLEVLVSKDCGNTYQRVYYKGGNDLKTATTTSNFVPTAAQWRKESVNLTAHAGGNLLVNFQSINNFGNNLYIDDININKFEFPNRDASIAEISRPLGRVCSSTEKPVVTLKNIGRDTLRSVKINYRVDNGAVATYNWTGVLPRNASTTVTLPDVNFGAAGAHTLTVFTSEPNGQTDQNTSNDQMAKTLTVFNVTPVNGSVTEEFTSTFPPSGWSVVNPNADMTWTRNANYGNKLPGSAWFNDWNNATNNRIDDLVSPTWSYSGTDSVFLHFNLSAATYSYPGTTGVPIDTLSVLVSKDCGNSFTEVYKKWGEDLQTIKDPNNPVLDEFFPRSARDWRRDSINLGGFLSGTESQVTVAFRFHGNFENNIFLDDVSFTTETLPATLKTQGYLILPTAFNNQFGIWHYQQPTKLKYVTVYNSAGQLVWTKQYNGNADKYIPVDLSGRAAGTYMVHVGYEDENRNVVQRVVKY
jgi:hypothetical protein